MQAYNQMVVRRFDYNGHGSIDLSDYDTLLANLGSTNWLYDLNGDGVVTSADSAIYAATFGVPEPATFTLVASAAGLLLAGWACCRRATAARGRRK